MKKETTKEKLLKASAILFSQRSFSDVTTREIANKAKVNLSAIKYYFSSKENLFIETLSLLLREIRSESIDAMEFEGEITQKVALDKFKSFVYGLTELMSLSRPIHPCKMMLRELLAKNSKNKKMCDELIRIVSQEFMAPFEEKGVKLLKYVVPNTSRQERENAFQVICAMCSHYLIAGDFIKILYNIDCSSLEALTNFSNYIINFTLQGLGIKKA